MSRTRLSAKGPSLAEVCRWANVDETTRIGWTKLGLARHVQEDATPDLATAIEIVVVARLLERLTPDDALIAWTGIGSKISALEKVPAGNRLDLLWFPSAPGESRQSDAARGVAMCPSGNRTRHRQGDSLVQRVYES